MLLIKQADKSPSLIPGVGMRFNVDVGWFNACGKTAGKTEFVLPLFYQALGIHYIDSKESLGH